MVMSSRRMLMSPVLLLIDICNSEAFAARSALVSSTSSNSLSILALCPPSSFLVANVLLSRGLIMVNFHYIRIIDHAVVPSSIGGKILGLFPPTFVPVLPNAFGKTTRPSWERTCASINFNPL